jgi:hypothetical protein
MWLGGGAKHGCREQSSPEGGSSTVRQLSGREAVVLQRQGAPTAVCSDLGCSYSSTQEGREGRL